MQVGASEDDVATDEHFVALLAFGYFGAPESLGALFMQIDLTTILFSDDSPGIFHDWMMAVVALGSGGPLAIDRIVLIALLVALTLLQFIILSFGDALAALYARFTAVVGLHPPSPHMFRSGCISTSCHVRLQAAQPFAN